MSFPTTTCPANCCSIELRAQQLLLGREVHAGEEHLGDGARRPAVRAGGGHRLVEELLEQRHGCLEPEMMGRGERSADVREQRPVGPHEREIGLRVPAVDRKDDPVAHRPAPADETVSSASRLSSSVPDSSS